MTTPRARYDGLAAWYDESAKPAAENTDALVDLLGRGDGLCLDLGCGTGHYFDVLRSTGRSVIGLDVSADQLRHARRRETNLVQAGAAKLPFADAAFVTVAAIWISTDVDDLSAVLREAARVLRPGGELVLFGVHPCFNGPCIEGRDDGARIVHPNYRVAGWHESSPWWGAEGIRHRVGMRHVPLAEYFTAILEAGLRITRVVEPREEAVPYVLAVTARRDH